MVEDLAQDIGPVYRTLGLKGLQSISSIEPILGGMTEKMLIELNCGVLTYKNASLVSLYEFGQ